MKKLSQLKRHPSTQSLVLFDDVLDSAKLLQSQEIKKLVAYFYDNYELSVVQIDNPERLHDYFREEQYRADGQNGAMIYPVKAPFDDLALEAHSDEFSGPLYVQVLSTDEAALNILTITCQWYDGLFRNDNYLVGVIANTADMEVIINNALRE